MYAQYTPVDTLVFGGNFLHSYDVPTRMFLFSLQFQALAHIPPELRVRDIEIATQVPKKFRFPMFTK